MTAIPIVEEKHVTMPNLFLKLEDIATVKGIAMSIARMDGRDRILVNHLAEALQYQPHVLPGFREWTIRRAVEVRTK